jgi:protein-tyrosine phosphatase
MSDSAIIPSADLHCHLLPNWDDGPASLELSLEMAQRAANSGLEAILVTPHVGRSFRSHPEPETRTIPDAVADLQREIDKVGVKLKLVSGAEIMLTPEGLPERLVREPWLCFGSETGKRYALVESPLHIWPDWADSVLFQMAKNGITPIIAHPERLSDVSKDVNVLERALNCGALLQITARSVVGRERPAHNCARKLMGAGLVSIIASDAHRAEHMWPREIVDDFVSLMGEEAAHQILVDNPRRILAGQEAKSATPSRPVSTQGSMFKRIGRVLGWT